MTEQERINTEVQTRLSVADANIAALANEMKAFKDEMKDFKDEMRDRDNQRHAEIEALRADTNAQMTEIRASINSLDKNMRNQTIVTFLGIAAMVIAILLK